MRLACPACGWIAYRQLKVGAGVLIERDGRLLLLKRGPRSSAFPDTWGLPAGYCEADEPPHQAAARETAEETGLRVVPGRLFGAFCFDDDPRGNGLLLVYEAGTAPDGPQASLPVADQDESVVCQFFSSDELPQPVCGGGHDQAIGAWRRRALDRWQPGMPLRYCPHCTAPLEERVAFGRQRPVCPSCGFVHFRELKVGVSLVVERGGRLLLVQRGIEPAFGKWSLPSGFVEWDEPPEAAARRECLEETGLVVEHLELIKVRHYTDDSRGPGINLCYHARVAAGHLQAGDDAQAARFLAAAELPPPDQIAFHGHQAVIAQWSSAQGGHAADPPSATSL